MVSFSQFWSVDMTFPNMMTDNLAHCSYEAGILEQPELTSPENMWTRTVGKDLTGAHHDV